MLDDRRSEGFNMPTRKNAKKARAKDVKRWLTGYHLRWLMLHCTTVTIESYGPSHYLVGCEIPDLERTDGFIECAAEGTNLIGTLRTALEFARKEVTERTIRHDKAARKRRAEKVVMSKGAVSK